MRNLSLMPERAGKPITSCSSGPGRRNTRCHMCVCWGLQSWTHSSWNDSHANCSSPLYARVWRYSAVFQSDFTALHVFKCDLFIFNSEQNFYKWPKCPEMTSFHSLTAWLACSTAVSMVNCSIADRARTHTSSSHVSLLFHQQDLIPAMIRVPSEPSACFLLKEQRAAFSTAFWAFAAFWTCIFVFAGFLCQYPYLNFYWRRVLHFLCISLTFDNVHSLILVNLMSVNYILSFRHFVSIYWFRVIIFNWILQLLMQEKNIKVRILFISGVGLKLLHLVGDSINQPGLKIFHHATH